MAGGSSGSSEHGPDCLACLLSDTGEPFGPYITYTMCVKHPQYVVVHGNSLLTTESVLGEDGGGPRDTSLPIALNVPTRGPGLNLK
jgi:hypothetical protein